MLYVFIPYYNEDTPEFKKSLESQTVKYILIKRNRKKSNILWTKAVNDFYRECKRWQGTKDDDVICIMNNDIAFEPYLFEDAMDIKKGEVYIPDISGIKINWRKKEFNPVLEYEIPNSFIGRCFFMTLGDFKRSGGFCRLLPHALADLDFGYRVCKKLTTHLVGDYISHEDHDYDEPSKWSLRSYDNPILWTIFLLRHPNRYTLLNILKAWYDGFRKNS